MDWLTMIFVLSTPMALVVIAEYFYPGTIQKCIMDIYNDTTLCYLDPSTIKFICNGNEVAHYNFTYFLEIKDTIKTNYDFILYEIPLQDHAKYDKYLLRYNAIEDVICSHFNSLNCLEFTEIQIFINAEDTPRPLELERTQYMISGNVLFDRAFIKWYLHNYYNINLNEEDRYSVTFTDHEQKHVVMPDFCYLLIKKRSYNIVNIINDL
jgi:hypothetical protein